MASAPAFSETCSQFNGFTRIVGAGARNHRHFASGFLDANFDDALVLRMGERRRLARGADRNQAIGSIVYLPGNEATKGFLVERAIFGEGRDESGD